MLFSPPSSKNLSVAIIESVNISPPMIANNELYPYTAHNGILERRKQSYFKKNKLLFHSLPRNFF